MLHHCIIAALQMAGAADWTELSLSFIENKRTPRNERYCKARCNSPERENTNVRIILFKISTGGTKGTRLLVIRSGVRRKFVSSSQMFTAPLSRPSAKLIPIIVPGDRLGWPGDQFRDATHFKRRPESANEETMRDPLATEEPGMVSGALLTARLCIIT